MLRIYNDNFIYIELFKNKLQRHKVFCNKTFQWIVCAAGALTQIHRTTLPLSDNTLPFSHQTNLCTTAAHLSTSALWLGLVIAAMYCIMYLLASVFPAPLSPAIKNKITTHTTRQIKPTNLKWFKKTKTLKLSKLVKCCWFSASYSFSFWSPDCVEPKHVGPPQQSLSFSDSMGSWQLGLEGLSSLSDHWVELHPQRGFSTLPHSSSPHEILFCFF